LKIIDDEAGAGHIHISMGFAGQQAPNYGVNNMILFMRGPDDGQMRVQLTNGSGVKIGPFQERLRKVLPERIVPWFATVLEREGHSAAVAQQRARQIVFGFEPGDVVSEVMSFGSPTPIEITAASPNLDHAEAYARKVEQEFHKISFLRDVQIQQTLNYPTVPITIDRQKAGLSGVTTKQVGDSVLVATSSSRMVARNYWQDPNSGVSYQVQVEVPTQRMNSAAEAETIPLEEVNPGLNLMVRDVAQVGSGVMPGEYDRIAMQRYISVTANVVGEDLGRAAKQIAQALEQAGKSPLDVDVQTRGQIGPMREMFKSLAIGLLTAVMVIFVLLTAYFQSPRLALVSLGAVPGVLSGVVLILLITGTTLNIESFMGTIMCIGVSVSNSVMLVTFTSRDWQQGRSAIDAAMQGARERLRPILMTACAMIVGMIPMSLALEAGSQMEAPLGRAVVGGLLVSTFSTLLMLPPIFAIVVGARKHQTPSLHPDDKESPHYDAEHAPDGGNDGDNDSKEATDSQEKSRDDRRQ
jgi:multidrug efflux pump subunit AcrB